MLDEINETVTVTLTNPIGAHRRPPRQVGTAVATATINDNDASVISVQSDTSVTEGGTLVFTVTRTLTPKTRRRSTTPSRWARPKPAT